MREPSQLKPLQNKKTASIEAVFTANRAYLSTANAAS